MAKAKQVPAIVDNPMTFCPGCGHGIVIRLITECLEEMGQTENIIFPIGVGCSSLLGSGLRTDRLHCPHGRAGAVATGMKRVMPNTMVVAYQGDGDAYSIGMAETMNAAYRNEKITVITINNTNFGMTGGQMSWTTLPQQVTSTSPKGRDCAITGRPFRFPELVASQFDVAYAARGSVTSPKNISTLKKYIGNALEAQLNGEGYSIVEALSPCPTNWHLTPVQSLERIEKDVLPHYPLGEFKTRQKKEG